MKTERIFLLFGFLFLFFQGITQVPDADDHYRDELSDPAVMSTDEESPGEGVAPDPEGPAPQSINLNTADKEALQALAIPVFQMESLLRYRLLLGSFLDLHELQAVPGWDPLFIRRILPFVYVSDEKKLPADILDRIREGQHSISLRTLSGSDFKKSAGDSLSGNDLLGDPLSLTIRYRFSASHSLQFGLLADKDAGESWGGQHQRSLFDFWSAHFFIKNAGPFRTLCLGDYSVCMGQGLIQWQGFSPAKAIDAIMIKRQAPLLSPYRAAGECNFYRGLAFTIPIKGFQATAFFSLRKWDAHAAKDSLTGRPIYVTSLIYSGLHRTQAEIESKSMLNRISWGGCIQHEVQGWKLGLNVAAHHHSLPLRPYPAINNLFAFRGKDLHDVSVDYGKTINNFHLFGELACSDGFSSAWIQGVMISMGRQADVSFLYRNISHSFHSLQSRAFTDSPVPTNEKGFYMGISLHPALHWYVRLSADIFRSSWPGYRMSAPSQGSEYRGIIKFIQRNRVELTAKFLCNRKNTVEAGSSQPVPYLVSNNKNQLNIDFNLCISRKKEFSGGFAGVVNNSSAGSNATGVLYYINYSQQPEVIPVGIKAGFQYFSTDSYLSRLYIIENQLLESSGFLGLYGSGYRFSLQLKYPASKKLQIQYQCAFCFSTKSFSSVHIEENASIVFPSWKMAFGIHYSF